MFSIMNFICFYNANQQTKPKTKYEVLGVIGEGRYGTVAKCRNRATGELVALKRIKNGRKCSRIFHRELEMLNHIKELDPDKHNLVKLVDSFEYNGCGSLAFEMLDVSVYDLLDRMRSFTLSQIRPMAKQLLVALYGLECVGVMHTDIKPDNIMLVNHKERPFKVKLIDFGLAEYSGHVPPGKIIQPIACRAPEVTLGLPLWEAVDMWGLACCLLKWFVRSTDFVGFSEFDFLSKTVHFFGVPSEKLLNMALRTSIYFVQENSKWRLKTLQEFMMPPCKPSIYSSIFSRLIRWVAGAACCKPSAANLEQLIQGARRSVSHQEKRDMEQFHDLLSKMFKLDPKERITPLEALDHPFVTMAHLPEGDNYTKEAQELMRVTEDEFGPLQETKQDTVEVDLRFPKSVFYAQPDDNIFFMTSHPTFFGHGCDTYRPIPPPSTVYRYKTVEMPRTEMDLRFPKPTNYSSDDNIFFMTSHPTFFGHGCDTYRPIPPPSTVYRYKTVEMPKMEVDLRFPKLISYSSDDKIFFTTSHPTFFGFGNGSDACLPKPPVEISVGMYKTVEMPKMGMDLRCPNPVTWAPDDNFAFTACPPISFQSTNESDADQFLYRSPGEISVCGSENSCKDLPANGDTQNLVYSPNTCSLENASEEDSPVLPSEGEAVSEEFIHNRERRSQFEDEDYRRSKSLATQNSPIVSRVEEEDSAEKPEDRLTEAEVILERLKEELPDCSEILEDIEKLFQDGEATEAELSHLTQKASRSFFARLIPRRLRALFSRLFKQETKMGPAYCSEGPPHQGRQNTKPTNICSEEEDIISPATEVQY